MLTKVNSEFALENVPLFGQSKLKITAIGFKSIEQNVSFDIKMQPGADMSAMLNAIDKDLGNIKLEVDAQVLGNVTVTASKPAPDFQSPVAGEEILTRSVVVYPNPVSDKCIVKFDGAFTKVSTKVYDVGGSLVRNWAAFRIEE